MASAPLPNPHDHSFQAAARRKEVYIGQSGLCHGRGVLAGRNLNRVQDAVVFTCVVDVKAITLGRCDKWFEPTCFPRIWQLG